MTSDSKFGCLTQSTFIQRLSDVDTDIVLDHSDILDVEYALVESQYTTRNVRFVLTWMTNYFRPRRVTLPTVMM
jgi:hypothetical protein